MANFTDANRTKFPPPCSQTMGFELVHLDEKAWVARVRYDGKEAFTNPAGFIQGGFISAMCDDVIGMLCSIRLAERGYPSTIDLHMHYLRPVRVGPVEVQGRIQNMGRSVIFADAELFDSRGKIAARATSSLAIMKT